MQTFSSLKLSVKPWFTNDVNYTEFNYRLVEIDKRNEAVAKKFVDDFEKKITSWTIDNQLSEITPTLKTATCSYWMKNNDTHVEYYQVCITPCANPHADCVAIREIRAQKLAKLDGLCRQVHLVSADNNVDVQYEMTKIFNSLPTEKDLELICKGGVDPFKEYLSAAVYKIIVPKRTAIDNVAKYANAEPAFNTINYKEARNYLNVECSRSRLRRAPSETKTKKKPAAAPAPSGTKTKKKPAAAPAPSGTKKKKAAAAAAAAAPLETPPKMSKFNVEKHKKMFEAFSLFKDVYTNIANYDYDTYYDYVITSLTYVIVQNDRIIGFIGLWPEDKYEENPTFLEVKYYFIYNEIKWKSMQMNIKIVLQAYYKKNKENAAAAYIMATIDESASEEQIDIFNKMELTKMIAALIENPSKISSTESSLPPPPPPLPSSSSSALRKRKANGNLNTNFRPSIKTSRLQQQKQQQQIRNMKIAQASFNLRSIGANSETEVPEGFEKIAVKPNGWCFYNVIHVALTNDLSVLNSNEASNRKGLQMATEVAKWLRDNDATMFTFSGGIQCTFRQYYTDILQLQEDPMTNTFDSRNVKQTKFTYNEYLQATVDLQDRGQSPSPRIFAQIEILGWAVAYMYNVNIDLYDKKFRLDKTSYTALEEGYRIRPLTEMAEKQTISILHTTMAHFDLLQPTVASPPSVQQKKRSMMWEGVVDSSED